MTDYWQSQAKKFCDFCKCWITDNKPSIEFHERGKKHKENVARKIKEVHKRGVQVVKDNDELKRNLQAIEDAALEAYRKDIGEEAFNQATQGTTTIRTTTPMLSHQKTHTHKEESKTTCAVPTSAGCTIVYNDGQPVAHCSHHWSIAQSPEGYYYYYNSKTLASQWEVPDCLQTEENDTTDEPSKQEQTQTQVSTSEKKEDKAEEKEKEIEENKDQGTKDNMTVKTFSPYGAWTTVRTIELPSNVSKTNDKEKPEESKEVEEIEGVQEDPEVTARKTENKFKERKMPKITFHKADDQVIAFKRRKLNNERKRNVRQTKFN